jgi:hypothetical protein
MMIKTTTALRWRVMFERVALLVIYFCVLCEDFYLFPCGLLVIMGYSIVGYSLNKNIFHSLPVRFEP